MSTNDKYNPGDIANSFPNHSDAVVNALDRGAQNSAKLLTPSELYKMLPEQKKEAAEQSKQINSGPVTDVNANQKQSSAQIKEEKTDHSTLSVPSELTPRQQSEWNKQMDTLPKSVTAGEMKNALRETLSEKTSDKLQIVKAVADGYTEKHVPQEMREAINQAIAKRAEGLDNDNSLPSIPIYDHKAASVEQTERTVPTVEQNSERSR